MEDEINLPEKPGPAHLKSIGEILFALMKQVGLKLESVSNLREELMKTGTTRTVNGLPESPACDSARASRMNILFKGEPK